MRRIGTESPRPRSQRAASIARTHAAHPLEALEPRTLLSDAPFPDIGLLRNPDNPVVRIETNLGCIDVEVFTDTAPLAAAHFLNYVRSGRFDLTFFDRLDESLNILYAGGGYYFDDAAGAATVQPLPSTPLDFTVPGTERTLAFAILGGQSQPVSQFFVNLQDNTSGPFGAFPVFGRVVGDAAWSVVTTIAGLALDDFFDGHAPEFTDVPVTSGTVLGAPMAESSLVIVGDIEIVKPQDVQAYFTQAVYFPEGFGAANINESIFLTNPNTTTAHYQIIVRYERAPNDPQGGRDQSVALGQILPDAHAGVMLSDGTSLSIVRLNKPFAIEVWTAVEDLADPLPVTATIAHGDDRGRVSEGFFSPGELADEDLMSWTFAGAARLLQVGDFSIFRPYLLYQNISDQDGTLTFTFFKSNDVPTQFTFPLEAHRRGGLQLFSMDQFLVGGGVAAIRVDSTVPIVASMSVYERVNGAPFFRTSAYGYLGSPSADGVGAVRGVLPGIEITNTTQTTLIGVNTSDTDATVTLLFRSFVAEPVQRTWIIPARRRAQFTLDASEVQIRDSARFGTPGPTLIALTYQSTAPVTLGYAGALLDGLGDGSPVFASPEAVFSNLEWTPIQIVLVENDPIDINTCTVFNPDPVNSIRVIFEFLPEGGDPIEFEAVVDPLGVARRDPFALLNNFYFDLGATSVSMSLRVRGLSMNGETPAPIIAQMTRYDENGPRNESSEFGTLLGPLTLLQDLMNGE